MELHLNARVLPSNAPVLQEDASGLLSTPTDLAETSSAEICQNYNRGNGCSACNLQHVCLRCKQHGHPATECECGVLRVSSGNVGSSVSNSYNTDSKTGDTQKYGFIHVSSLVNPPRHSAQAAIKAEHPRRQQPSSWSLPKGYPWYWHVEYETPRYRAYRDKIRGRGSKDEKWPDLVEEAFQLGIRIYQRRGRKKSDLNGKQAGGNEFISDFIRRTTGYIRNRKQVSSHIQVEKKFMEGDNPAWMSLVAPILSENSKKKAHGSIAHEEIAGAYENLEYEDVHECRPSPSSYPPFPNRSSTPLEIIASGLLQGPTLRRVSEFTMTLRDEGGSKAVRHTYTSIQSETPSAPRALADVINWREMYPDLAACCHDGGPVDCPMFLFDTHLSLLGQYYPSNLDIRLFMDFSQGAHFTNWRSYPKFYERNGCPVDLTESWDVLESEQLEGTDNSRLGPVYFRSAWWVQVFSSMINKKMIVEKKGDSRLMKEEEERAIQYVQGLSVMQEIWATHRASKRGPQRMAILLWRFSAARRGEVATTSWRKLLPPVPEYDVQSPHPPSETPPMILDTTLEAASPYVAHHETQPSIFSGYPAGDLLTAPLSKDSSSSTTPTPGSRSFPSSASNSACPLYPSQESSFHSQGSAYPPLDIFDSQDSGYTLYEQAEVVEASQESYGCHESADCSQESYASQEVIYHSQESLYQGVLDQLYEYPCQIVDAPVIAAASQDFTGGQIELSYAQTEDSQSSYEAPLIAPQAHMVPQHQLIQHPEQFDQHDYLEPNPDDVGCGPEGVDEQAQAQPLAQSQELNGLIIDYSGWEETLRLNPDLERHLSINTMDEVGHSGQQYVSPVGQERADPTQGEMLGEVQDEGGSPERQLECQ